MPRLNLKDEGLDAEGGSEMPKSSNPTPMLREVGGGGGRISPIILIVLIVVILAGGVYALNHFKVIRLWGKKAPVVTETLPEPDLPIASQTQAPAEGGSPAATGNENLPLPSAGTEKNAQPATAATSAPAGSGRYTVQFAAWMSKSKADEQATLLSAAGFEAFVDETEAASDHWFRVRVGRFDSRTQAQEVVAKLQPMTEDVVWIATLRQK